MADRFNATTRRTFSRAGLLLVIVMGFLIRCAAQDTGTAAGVVVNSFDGAPLAGVTVTARGTTLATQTDSTGRFELKNIPPGDQVLRISKSGFATTVVTEVRVIAGQTTPVNGNLRPEFYELEEFEVTAEVFTQQTEQILIEKQKSVVMVDAIGADTMSKAGAANAGDAVAKVSGSTIVDGKFAVVRGLSDHYVSTTLNGANLPSADPYRQSAPLDLFPSQVISKVLVSKTFTPDQPGSFTGGGIDIVTKSFPEKSFVSVSIGGAYNAQANLNGRFLTYNGGKQDWTGMDDGTRALPGIFDTQAPITADPQKNPAIPPIRQANLATNNPAFANNVLNDKLIRALGVTEFAPHTESAPLNHNLSLAGGGSSTLFGQPLGYFLSGSYKHDYSAYENGVNSRYESGTQFKNRYRDARSLSTVNWSTMLNLAYQPIEDHEVDFLYFYNQNSVDDARIQDQGVDTYTEGATYRKFNLYWTERNLNTYQLKGKHDFPEVGGLHIDWLAALTQTTQDEPDARFFNDVDTGNGYTTDNGSIPSPNKPTRYFRNLEENNRNLKLDGTLPFHAWTEAIGNIKLGLLDSSSTRDFTERQAYYNSGFLGSGGGYQNDPNLFLNPGNLGATFTTNANGSVRSQFNKYVQGFESTYNGQLDIQAGYLMLELPVVETLRWVGGARYETTDYQVFSKSYLTSNNTRTNINNSRLNQTDLLPSFGLIYAMQPNMNLRLNYGETVARPSYRELSAYYGYDPVVGEFVEGNPTLKMSAARNYDVRWEWFPHPGELLSVSVFYKDIKDAIERGNNDIQGEVITFFNNDAKLYGVELEARKTLEFLGDSFKPFSLGGNFSLLQSEVHLSDQDLQNKRAFFPGLSDTRPLYDQSPYILNVDFNFEKPDWGTSASLILNVSGPRITLTKLNTADVYEQPAPTLDFVYAQKLGANTSFKFSAKNLLNPAFERTYGKNSSLIYSSYKKGTTFGLSFTYDF